MENFPGKRSSQQWEVNPSPSEKYEGLQLHRQTIQQGYKEGPKN